MPPEAGGEPPAPAWRTWEPTALDAVMALAGEAHPGMPERPEVFARKAELFPEGAFQLRAATDGPILGYALAHPWRQGFVPPLDYRIEALPDPADCLFLHDCVVAEAARGAGAAGLLVGHLQALARARRLPALTLLAAYGSARLWSRHGFAPFPLADPMLLGYGPTTVPMACPVA